jgi:hypothetical protein
MIIIVLISIFLCLHRLDDSHEYEAFRDPYT